MILFQGGSYLLDIVDGYVVGFPTLFIGLFELIVVAWLYGEFIYCLPTLYRCLFRMDIRYVYLLFPHAVHVSLSDGHTVSFSTVSLLYYNVRCALSLAAYRCCLDLR